MIEALLVIILMLFCFFAVLVVFWAIDYWVNNGEYSKTFKKIDNERVENAQKHNIIDFIDKNI